MTISFKNQSGFTLVELAIVLMIIGLLIGGVLRGQELLRNAEITSTIEQVKAFSAATKTFTEEYGALPGDYNLATTRIPNCTAQNSCQNGNGDSIIGVLNPGQGQYANEPWQSIDPAITSENTQYWKHLALAHLITGVDPSASTPEWGRSQPAGKIGNAGFFISYTNFNVPGFPATWTGHIAVLRKNINGAYCANASGFCAASPKIASQLDRKMDDGVATTGDVWAISGNWSVGCGLNNSGTNGPNGYAETSSEETCDMMFKIH
jgi:prepilin-type N-terminal cleavage/methylation domain-containing protein